MKKMVLNPSSYYACREVIEHYKQNELYKVLESVDMAVRNKEQDKTVSNVNELGVIMENVWKDAHRIRTADEITKGGMALGVAAVGSFATSMLGAGVGVVEGLLTGLGFNVADRVLGKFDSSISNRILKLLNKDYIMNIYNFQKKIPAG